MRRRSEARQTDLGQFELGIFQLVASEISPGAIQTCPRLGVTDLQIGKPLLRRSPKVPPAELAKQGDQ